MSAGAIMGVSMCGHAAGAYIVNYMSWYVVTGDLPTLAEAGADMMPAVQASIQPAYLACLSQDYSLDGIRIIAEQPSEAAYVQLTPGVIGSLTPGVSVAGAGGIILLPYVGHNGKNRVTRMLLPCVPDGFVADNRPTDSYRELLEELAAAMSATLEGASQTYRMACHSYKYEDIFQRSGDLYPSAHVAMLRRRNVDESA